MGKRVAFSIGIGYIAPMAAEIIDLRDVKRTVMLKGAERTGTATATDMTEFAVRIIAGEPEKGYHIEIGFPGLDSSGTVAVLPGEEPFAYHDTELDETVNAVPA